MSQVGRSRAYSISMSLAPILQASAQQLLLSFPCAPPWGQARAPGESSAGAGRAFVFLPSCVSSPSYWGGVWPLYMGVTGRQSLSLAETVAPSSAHLPTGPGLFSRWAWQAGQRHSVAGGKLFWPCSLHTDLCASVACGWPQTSATSLTEPCWRAHTSSGLARACRLW